jgi:REP element-mobilizing transposase RayT
MSSNYVVTDSQLPHFITFTVVGWADVFSREQYKEVMCKSLQYCINEKGLLLHAWVIMTNHVHLIVSTQRGFTIPIFVRDCKKFTSKKIVAAIEGNQQESRKQWLLNMFAFTGRNNNENEIYQFWQQEYRPIALDTPEKVLQRLNYLHQNPVRAGIVWFPEEYKYSSAIDYYTKQNGLLPLNKLDI